MVMLRSAAGFVVLAYSAWCSSWEAFIQEIPQPAVHKRLTHKTENAAPNAPYAA